MSFSARTRKLVQLSQISKSGCSGRDDSEVETYFPSDTASLNGSSNDLNVLQDKKNDTPSNIIAVTSSNQLQINTETENIFNKDIYEFDSTSSSCSEGDDSEDHTYLPSDSASFNGSSDPLNVLQGCSEGDDSEDHTYLPSDSASFNGSSDPLNVLQDTTITSVNNVTNSATKSTTKYNRRNCCPYCMRLITNFTRHITAHHSKESEVIEFNGILDPDLRERKKKREAVSAKLRNRGNYLYNQKVLSQPDGGFVIPNHRTKSNNNIQDYATCIHCCGTFKRKLLYRHVKKCNTEVNQNPSKRTRVLKSSAILLTPHNEEITETLKNEIFPSFKDDNIAVIAKNDPLICAYGALLLSNHKEYHLKTHITSKMRSLAKLFQQIKLHDPSISSFELAFDPVHFDFFMKSVKIISGYDETTGFVSIPSMPARICTAIKDCVDILMRRSIQSAVLTTASKEKIKAKLSDFKSIFNHSWKFEISTNAEKSRKTRKMLKTDVMPLLSDIKLLCEIIQKREVEAALLFDKEKSYGAYEELVKITIAHIIIFNRRRAGEVARAPLENYISCQRNSSSQEIPQEILDVMSDEEKEAINSLYCFHIPGKRGRTVPILLREQMKKNVDTIFAYRELVGIPATNTYLFSKLGGEPYFCGSKILRDLRSELSLTNPDHMTSTGLRHHVATMSQISGKNNSFVNALSHFLGHTPGTHKGSYMLPQLALEKGKVGLNLLQLAEGKIGPQKQSAGISVSEVRSSDPISAIEELTTSENMDTNMDQETQSRRTPNNDKSEELTTSERMETNMDQETQSRRTPNKDESDSENLPSDDSFKGKSDKTIKTKIVRKRWLQQEKDQVYKHFAKYFIEGKDPGASKINELKKKGILPNRSWKQINTFINNHHTKNLKLPDNLQRQKAFKLSDNILT